MFATKCRFAAVPIAMGILCALAVPWLSGCGGPNNPDRTSVSGKVIMDGQPLDGGTISFVPTGTTTGPSSGGKIENGLYTITPAMGPVVGTHRVLIYASHKTGRKIEAGSPFPSGTMVDEIQQCLPPKYNTQTELTAEIKPGKNQVDFDLQTKP